MAPQIRHVLFPHYKLLLLLLLIIAAVIFPFARNSEARANRFAGGEVAAMLPPINMIFHVDTTGDGVFPGACGVAPTPGQCSLREAIIEANAHAGADTIDFIVNGTINLLTALPDISDDVTISGPGANLLTVARSTTVGTPDFGIFTISTGKIVNISGVTISGARTSGNGGGINNSGKLTLTGVEVSDNQGLLGGGIFSFDSLTISNSTVSGNHTGSSGFGGGLFVIGDLKVTNSTISDNQAGGGGGLLLIGDGTMTMTGSTITGNSATGASFGGGIANTSATITIRSTIIGGNTATTGPDISGAIQSDGFNLIQNTSGTTINQNPGAGPNITGQDPLLNPLAHNGGPTRTHSLQPTSPAIDQGKNFTSSCTDQRGAGFLRTIDASIPSATGGDGTDIGSFELQNPPPAITLTVNTTADTNDGTCDVANCTLREAINAVNSDPAVNARTINFNIPNTDPGFSGGVYTITLLTALPDIAHDLTIQGLGANVLTIKRDSANVNRFRIFTINSGKTVNISGVTITGGRTADHLEFGGNGDNGGGISNSGTLTLTSVEVRGNRTGAGNQNGGFGGGIASFDTLTTPALTIINSTISGNQTGSAGFPTAGGGIFATGTMTVINSTISGNQTGSGQSIGGGLFLSGGGTMTLAGCTIAGNSTTTTGVVALGGGIVNFGATVTIKSTIIGGNTAPTAPDIVGAFQSDGFNLIQNTSGATINQNPGAGPNITGQDPLLNPLADNGGPTRTHSLQPTSPAIDQGKNLSCPTTTDQRGSGFLRTFDDPGKTNATGGDGTDIGAFELQNHSPSEQIADLMKLIDTFNLKKAVDKKFDHHLDEVLKKLDEMDKERQKGKSKEASHKLEEVCKKLAEFIKDAQHESGKKLTAAQATQIIDAAKRIAAVLGC
jgi:CSLREA domain-containing protein